MKNFSILGRRRPIFELNLGEIVIISPEVYSSELIRVRWNNPQVRIARLHPRIKEIIYLYNVDLGRRNSIFELNSGEVAIISPEDCSS